jgi:hypothetical protein
MINDIELDQLEKQRQRDSDWVIDRLTLYPILRNYGKVKVVGAKALGLMVAKDIDISVVVDTLTVESWKKMVNELMSTPYTRNISAIDYYNYDAHNNYDPSKGQKYSLYVGINNIMGSESDKYDTWECQIHLIEPRMFDETKIAEMKRKLNPQNRMIILRLKWWAHEVNRMVKALTNGNHKINSQSIYEAVLDKEITSVDMFLESYRPSVPDLFQRAFKFAITQVEDNHLI